MFTNLNPFRLLETRSGVQVYPSPVEAALQRRSSLSIFQQCSRIRSCLLSDPIFARYLEYCADRPDFDPSDPVSHLWDCFALGIPLCYLYNCLAKRSSSALVPLTISTDLSMLQASTESNRVKKRAIYIFAIEVRKLNPEWTSLTVSDLMNDRVFLDGFMKFLFVVDAILDMFPKETFGETRVVPIIEISRMSIATDGPQLDAVWKQLIASERSYVKDLDRMLEYTQILRQNISPNIVDRLFPMFNQLVNFQRWFCIHIETIASLSLDDQHLGLLFVDNEPGFASVYEPYCANVTTAADLILIEESRLAPFNSLISVRGELPALILAPSHRLYSYPIILENMLKTIHDSSVDLKGELEQGLAAMTRVSDVVNAKQRRATTQTIVEHLGNRVKDWQGLNVADLGDLILVDVLTVVAPNNRYESHVFLFQDMILCLWDSANSPPIVLPRKLKRGGMNKRRRPSETIKSPRLPKNRVDVASSLLLKHTVRLSDIIFATSSVDMTENEYLLVVSWRKDDIMSPEQLQLHFSSMARLKEWNDNVVRLVDDFGRAERESMVQRDPSVFSNSTSTDDDIPIVHVESVAQDKHELHHAASIRSHHTQSSAEDHVISYYFNGLLSPGYNGRDYFSINSREDTSEYDTTSILAAYERNRTPSPASTSSPGSDGILSSPKRRKGDEALHLSPQTTEQDAQYRKDVTFAQTLLRLEGSPDALTLHRGDAAAVSLDLLQGLLDRMQYHLQAGSMPDAQVEEGHTLWYGIRRILLKLARESDILPPSLFIAGLHIPRIDRAVCLGGFADIYLGSYKGEAVAVKRLRVTDEQISMNPMIWKEALIWRQLNHPYVLKFIGVDQETFNPHTCMVSPWLPHGNVISYMKREGPENVEVERLLYEIAQGIEYLHAQGVIHGDLRGSNVLVDSGHHPRLADFGLGTISEATTGSHTAKGGGSIRWMAPELLRAEGDFQRTLPTDVYSYGCICIELYTCARPYPEIQRDEKVFFHVVYSGRRPTRPTAEQCHGNPMPDHFWNIAQNCWKENTDERPLMHDVVGMMSSWYETQEVMVVSSPVSHTNNDQNTLTGTLSS